VYVGNGGAYGNYGITSPQSGESSTITINGTLFAGLGGAAAANGISTNPQPAAALGGTFLGSGGTGTTGATGGAGGCSPTICNTRSCESDQTIATGKARGGYSTRTTDCLITYGVVIGGNRRRHALINNNA